MIVYAIRHRPTGGYLPEIVGGRGYTITEPTVHRIPRLFESSKAAKCALTWWLKGITQVTRHYDGWEYDESWATLPREGRKAKDMVVVPMTLQEAA